MCAKSLQWCPALCNPMDYSLPMEFSDKNIGVGCHPLFQRIFLTQRPNPRLLWLLPCRWFFISEPLWCPPWRESESESEVAQSCLTLCNPMDCSLPGSSVHGIFQARVLEWVAILFCRGSSRPPGLLHYRWILNLWNTREAHKWSRTMQLILKRLNNIYACRYRWYNYMCYYC